MRLKPGAYRFLLALIVVLHHSTPLRLGAWAVGQFFCLSGFWIAEIWERKYSRLSQPYLEFLLSRWWRLAPVLFGTTCIIGAVTWFGFVPGDLSALKHLGWWISQPLIVGSASQGRLIPPAWSLDVEMQFYILAPCIITATRSMAPQVLAAVIAAAIGWCGYAHLHGFAGESPRLDVWIGVFSIGVLASRTRWRPGKTTLLTSVSLTLLIFAVAAAAAPLRPWILLRGSTGHVLTGIVPTVLTVGTILLSLPFAIWTTGNPSNRLDRMLGDLSFPLYLFHWLPRQWYYQHVGEHPHAQNAAIALAINLCSSILGALAILFFVDRPIQLLRARWISRQVLLRAPAADLAIRGESAKSQFAGTG